MSDPTAVKDLILYGVYPICTFIISGAGWVFTNKLKEITRRVDSVGKQVVELRVETVERLSVVETKVDNCHEKKSRY